MSDGGCMDRRVYDLFLFLGQSNMAGRGAVSQRFPESWPDVDEAAGYEYRAVSDPGHLCPIEEPFGKEENREGGIDDRWGETRAKSGSLVSAFVNAWYEKTHIPIIGISASKGGSAIARWTPGTAFHIDLSRRIRDTRTFIEESRICVSHSYVLFCQGETDGDEGTSKDDYKSRFLALKESLDELGFEKYFLILVGKCNIEGSYDRYDAIREAQKELAREHSDIFVVSSFEPLFDLDLMKDEFHYFQRGYNLVGAEAGRNAGEIAGLPS